MAYDETPRKKIIIREGKNEGFSGHDALIDEAKEYCKYGVRSDAEAEGVGFLGMDDLDRIRRRKTM